MCVQRLSVWGACSAKPGSSGTRPTSSGGPRSARTAGRARTRSRPNKSFCTVTRYRLWAVCDVLSHSTVFFALKWFPALGDEGSTLVEAVNTSSVHRVYAPWALVALGNDTHRFHRGASFDAQALLTAKRHPCALLAAESDFYREFGRADADANVIR